MHTAVLDEDIEKINLLITEEKDIESQNNLKANAFIYALVYKEASEVLREVLDNYLKKSVIDEKELELTKILFSNLHLNNKKLIGKNVIHWKKVVFLLSVVLEKEEFVKIQLEYWKYNENILIESIKLASLLDKQEILQLIVNYTKKQGFSTVKDIKNKDYNKDIKVDRVRLLHSAVLSSNYEKIKHLLDEASNGDDFLLALDKDDNTLLDIAFLNSDKCLYIILDKFTELIKRESVKEYDCNNVILKNDTI